MKTSTHTPHFGVPRQGVPSQSDSMAGADGNSSSWIVASGLLLIGVCAICGLDQSLASLTARAGGLPGDLTELLEAAEHFGTVWGQALILWMVFVFDRRRAFRIPRVAATALMGGLAANLIKLGVGRERPKFIEFANFQIGDSFSSWLPLGDGGSQFQSFPSAHTASAFAFAVAMSWAYPKGRTAFLTLAALVALQRIETNSHFLSDTLVGAACGWMMGCWSVQNSRLSRWWDALEQRWQQRFANAGTLTLITETGESIHPIEEVGPQHDEKRRAA